MRLLNVGMLKAGHTLGVALRTQEGHVLLPEKAVLTDLAIERLKSFGVLTVFIEDERFSDVEPESMIDDETWLLAIETMSEIYKSEKRNIADNNAIKRVAKEISSDIRQTLLTNPVSLYKVFTIKDARVSHSINVAILSAALAVSHGAPYTLVEEITQSALLHDFTLAYMTEDQKNVAHPEEAAQILKDGHAYSARVYMGVLQHHEKYDGTGFPKRLNGEMISETARIIALADHYDNLSNGYGCKKQPFHHAFEALIAESGKFLDPKFVSLFNSIVAVYPLGATVRLNNGLKAVVIAQNRGTPARPKVRLLRPNFEECLVLNLLTQTTIFIDEVEL